jgi:hypothetical protein
MEQLEPEATENMVTCDICWDEFGLRAPLLPESQLTTVAAYNGMTFTVCEDHIKTVTPAEPRHAYDDPYKEDENGNPMPVYYEDERC